VAAGVSLPSTKPYLIRAIYEWCAESGFTPYLSVKVDSNTRVPLEYVKNGEIVLNISMSATRNLTISNDLVQFSARFNGVSREVSVPIYAITGVFSRENGHGQFFQHEEAPPIAAPGAVAPAVARAEPASAAESGSASEGDAPNGSQPGRGRLKLVK
jgi:stringent starvation protein B